MSQITQERMQELVAYYAELKQKVLQVDRKYSTDFQDIQLDLPESLELQPLQYVAKTQQELQNLSQQAVMPSYLSSKNKIDMAFHKNNSYLQGKITYHGELLRKKLAKLLADYDKECRNLYVRLVNNGLLFSSVTTTANNQAREDYNAKVNEANTHYDAQVKLLISKITQLNNRYLQQCENLEEEKQAKITDAYNKLIEEENKAKDNVEKYNNALQEKETKYRASCQKAYEYARQAEYERSLEAARLFAQLGATGVNEQKINEKLSVCKRYFAALTRAEGQAILSMDSFLMNNLETAYDSFVEWVNTVLRPS